MVSHLDALLAHGAECTESEAAALERITLDLVGALCAEYSPTDSLLARIKLYIQHHAADSGLCPAQIAAAHHVSLRYVHRLFQAESVTVSAYIRAARLERCRTDLADPRHDGRPVHAIGARWGFADPSHFTRVFREAYGATPFEYRSGRRAAS
ncbi:MAG: helix-turn-helix transcriptional regulator [Mycobacteriaceae bacterium]|nr:helix-turn-helix transcriptional regulator [Mycobacteriaceae bacterium]